MVLDPVVFLPAFFLLERGFDVSLDSDAVESVLTCEDEEVACRE